MKTIFLDVDGVLTNSGYLNYETRHINPEKVRLLSQIVKKTGAVIVLTSTWKDGYNKKTGEKPEKKMNISGSWNRCWKNTGCPSMILRIIFHP